MKKYNCFFFLFKKKKQNVEAEIVEAEIVKEQIVEAEIVEAEIVEAEIVEAEFPNKTNEIMIKPEYIYRLFINCIFNKEIAQVTRRKEINILKKKYDLIGYIKANKEGVFIWFIHVAINQNNFDKLAIEELIFYHNKNKPNEYMLNIFLIYFYKGHNAQLWLKDYIKQIIFEHCSSSISKQHFVDLIKNNE